MRVQLSRPTYIIVASSSVVYATWKILLWRSRKRARATVDRINDLVKDDAPLIDIENPRIREKIFTSAIRRASKWIALSEDAQPMIGQVGGVSVHKKPLLTLKPDYVLKPLLSDHRGIREIAFYEAIKTLSHNPTNHIYSNFLSGGQDKRRYAVRHVGEFFDTLAVAFAIVVHDPVVVGSEIALKDAWKRVRKEVEALHTLAKFTAPYYGVMGQNEVNTSVPYGVTENAHLLLQDLTINFSKPCVMDLKMGIQTYEPDAHVEKRTREFGKYPQQVQFGIRIVGMRFYDPGHPESDSKGFRYFGKSYGREITTREDLLSAMRLFFSGGVSKVHSENGGKEEPSVRIRRKCVSNLLVQLRPLRRWFEENHSLRFYASSLLIVYEGDTSEDVGNGDMTSIKMIDFGRVRREKGPDTGYLAGLRTLKHLFSDLLDESEDEAHP